MKLQTINDKIATYLNEWFIALPNTGKNLILGYEECENDITEEQYLNEWNEQYDLQRQIEYHDYYYSDYEDITFYVKLDLEM